MSERFEITSAPMQGVFVVRRKPIEDIRGFFERMFCTQDLQPIIGDRHIKQINRSLTRRCGAVRGMHYQKPPRAEMKIVSCLQGRVYDVVVDIRRGSPTFLQWFGVELGADNFLSIVVPEGCAHGFQTLEQDCELLYLHTELYSPIHEGGLHPQDPRLAISWPLPVAVLSERDAQHPLLTDEFVGLDV